MKSPRSYYPYRVGPGVRRVGAASSPPTAPSFPRSRRGGLLAAHRSYGVRTRRYRVVIEPDDNGAYHIYAPALPGCHSCGKTIAGAKHNIVDAIRLYLDSLREHGESPPPGDPEILLDVVKVNAVA